MTTVEYANRTDAEKIEEYRIQESLDRQILSQPTSEYLLGSEYLGNSLSDRVLSNWTLFSLRHKNSTPSLLFSNLEKFIDILYGFLSIVYKHSNFAKRDDIEPVFFDKDDDGDLSITWRLGTSLLLATMDSEDFSWTLRKDLIRSLVEARFVTGSLSDFDESMFLLVKELKGFLN